MWGMLCHFAALVGFIIPFGNFIGPLVVWQIKKNEFPFADDQGKESLNFQITALIACLPILVLMLVPIVKLLMFPLAFALGIAVLVLVIMAGIKANNGETYRYPFALRFIK